MTMLTTELVREVLNYCCFEEDELEKNFKQPEDGVKAVGYNYHGNFHPGRLKEKTPLICEMIDELPDSFRTFQGDVFLNISRTKQGERWTNSTNACDALVTLGIAARKVHWTYPREMWFIFAGEMPFLRATFEGFVPDTNYKDMSKYRVGRECSHLVQMWLKSFKPSLMMELIGEGTKEKDIIPILIRTFQLRDQAEIAAAVVNYMVLWLISEQGRTFLKLAYQLDDTPALIRVPATLSENGQKKAAEIFGTDPSTLTVPKIHRIWEVEEQGFFANVIYRTGGDSGVSNETWAKVNYGAPDTAEIVVDTFIGWLNSHVGRCFIRDAFELEIPTSDPND